MKTSVFLALGLAAVGILLNVYNTVNDSVKTSLDCIEVSSSGSFGCQDSGGFDSTCATAKCPDGYILTGGGGACAAGDRKIKSLIPRFATGEFTIACEQQGVAPQARAICCKPQP